MQYIAYIHSSACVSQHTAHHTETESPDPLPPVPGASMLSMAWYMSSIDMPPTLSRSRIGSGTTLSGSRPGSEHGGRLRRRRLRLRSRLLGLASIYVRVVIRRKLIRPGTIFRLDALTILRLGRNMPGLARTIVRRLRLLLRLCHMHVLHGAFSSAVRRAAARR